MPKFPVLKLFTAAAAILTVTGLAHAEDKSPWMVRVRALDVVPQESSTVSIGGKATVGDAVVPELDISYFWTDHVATELILATTKHHVNAVGTGIGDASLGSVWLLPPTLLMQYHFTPDAKVRPYVGAGVNYTFFYNEKAGDLDKISYKDGFGFALQAGVDVPVSDHWSVNFDLKKVWLKTDVTINDGLATAKVNINPWIAGVGFGYRF